MRTPWLLLGLSCAALLSARAEDNACITCHAKVTPSIVVDWRQSAHSKKEVDCSVCHGDEHKAANDAHKAKIPTPETCSTCHPDQVKQFGRGKHALAWASMKAMPTFHWQPMALTDGMKGCGGCHKLGLKTKAEMAELKRQGNGFGTASCDACHTRHSFSKVEAQQPQACQTCHTGFDHPQWEMYSGSKHGVRYLLKQSGVLPATTVAPTCQTCHMSGGNHEVRTSWGFLGVRLPMPDQPDWAADRTTILQGLGVLDPLGNATPRLDVLKAAQVASLTHEDWQSQRDSMLKTCNQCHSVNFARGELAKGDQMIRAADSVMARAIRTVGDLYKDGLLKKPASYGFAFPDLLTFHDSPSLVEQKLFVMFLEHRMRAFQGTFHANPDYALWYGWSELQRDMTEINALAEDLRRRK